MSMFRDQKSIEVKKCKFCKDNTFCKPRAPARNYWVPTQNGHFFSFWFVPGRQAGRKESRHTGREKAVKLDNPNLHRLNQITDMDVL